MTTEIKGETLTTEKPAMFESRKWKAALIATALLVFPSLLLFVLVLTDRASVDQLLKSLATTTVGVGAQFVAYIIGVAMEDTARKGAPIAAGGDVTVHNAPPEARLGE